MKHFFLFIALLGVACAARLTGSITAAATSTPPKYTTVYARDTETGRIYQSRTPTNSYNLLVQGDRSYWVQALGSSSLNVSGWSVDGFLPYTVGRVSFTGDESKTADLVFEPAYTLVLLSHSNGTLKTSQDFSQNLWATDLSQGSTARFYRTVATQGGHVTAALTVPLTTSVAITTQVQVTSGASYLLPADNGGQGFGSDTQGGDVVHLNYETARTHTNKFYQKFQKSEPVDSLDGPFESDVHRAAVSDQVLEQSIAAEVKLELAKAESSILQFRTSNVSVRGTDESGRKVPGLSVSIKQETHSFRFGVYGGQQTASSLEAWKLLADSGVNAAVVDFWWSKTEPQQGTIEEDYILNQKIDYLSSLGLGLRATGLFQPDPSIVPDYVKGLTQEQFGKALYDHVYSVVSRYCTGFELIEVSTDLNNLVSLLGFNSTELLALQQTSLEAIQAAAPGVKTSVTVSSSLNPKSKSSLTPQKFQQLLYLGQPIDQIGLALYNEADQPSHGIGALSDLLDAASSSSGIPIRISRATAPGDVAGSEGEYLQQLYTIAFSKNQVKEVSWWSFVGDNGLFTDKLAPTASYWALRNFILSRRSDIQLSVDNGNTQIVTPYGGTHSVTVYKDGEVVGTNQIRLDEGRQNNLIVVYRSDGTSNVFLNQAHGPVLGLVPAPLATSGRAGPDDSGSNSGSRLPQWSVFVIIFGTVGVVSTIALLAALAVVRRSRTTKEQTADISAGTPAGTIPGKTFDIDLEAGRSNLQVGAVAPLDDSVPDLPSPWSGQPLTNVVLEEIEDETQEQSEESDSGSSDLEDVALDEQDVSTSTTDTEEEEHL